MQAGKQGVSNTFASALWGAELMYQVATRGGIGINFHGGGCGWYTPFAGTLKGITECSRSIFRRPARHWLRSQTKPVRDALDVFP